METRITVPQEPIIIERNQKEIDAYTTQAEKTQERLQNVVTAYQSLGLGVPTYQELKQMILQGSEGLIRAKLAGSAPVSIGGLRISTDKLQAMLELPDLSELDKALSYARGFNEDVIIYNEGIITVNAAAIESYTDSMTTYANTTAEKELYLISVEIQERLQYLQDRYGVNLIANSNEILRQYPATAGMYGGPAKTVLNKSYLTQRFKNLA